MEYQGQGWMDPDSNQVYAQAPTATEGQRLCPVCEMEVDPKLAPTSLYKGRTYYFCSREHKEQFEAAPHKFTNAAVP